MGDRSFAAVAVAALFMTGAVSVAAPTAEAVTYVNVYLLLEWQGAGCVGTGTGTSISLVARDMWQALGTKTKSWPSPISATRCPDDAYDGKISVGPVSLIKYDGYHTYRLEATITDNDGSKTFYSSNQNMRIGSSCVGSTYYMGTNDVYCSSNQPASNHLGVKNDVPEVASISSIYPDYPDPETQIYLYWSGVSPKPSDFDWWEVHMSKNRGFEPSYTFPDTLIAKRSWGFNYYKVTGLDPGTEYCFKIRNADRYWEPDSFTYRKHHSFGESGERCVSTRAADLTVTSPNGGEIWSGVHPVTWRGGSSDYKVDVSSNNGGSFTTVATGVGGLSANWDTRAFPDGTNYVVRVTGGAGATDASDAVFTVDNTPPVTTATVTGAQCNGWYSEAPLVTLSATDNLAGVRNTYWRADGGAATAYAGPFRLQGDGARAFEAWSDDRADKPNVETPSGATTVQVDTLDPFTNLSAGLPNHLSDRWYVNSSTPLSFSVAEDGSGVTATSFRVDGGAWLTWDGQPFTLTGPDREVVIDYFSEDDACHTEATRSTTLFLDNTRPDIELTEPNSGSVYRDGDEALAALGLLIELLEAIVGPVPDVQVPEGPVTPEQLCDIARILAQGFRDEGYPDELADLVLLLLCPRPDVGGPVVVTGDVTVRADATDPVVNGGASGLNRVEFLVNGVVRATDTEAPFEWVWNTSEDGGGTHALTVVAFDNLGQDASDGREVVVVDEPQPDVDVDVCGLVDALPVADYIKVLVRYVLVDLLGIGCVPALPLPAVGAP